MRASLFAVFVVQSLFAQTIPEPPIANTLFFLPPGKTELLRLEEQPGTARKQGNLAIVEFHGRTSPFRVTTTQPAFVINSTVPPNKLTDTLIRLESVSGKRTVMLIPGPGNVGIPRPSKTIEVEYKSIRPKIYLVRPVSPLAPGEYGISFGKSKGVALFGVEADATTPEEPAVEPRSATEPQSAPTDDRRKTLESLLQKKLITEADYRAKLAEIAAPPGPPSVEDRLRKLDELLKKGLITKSDYQIKRAQILSEL